LCDVVIPQSPRDPNDLARRYEVDEEVNGFEGLEAAEESIEARERENVLVRGSWGDLVRNARATLSAVEVVEEEYL
jgi:hypothetical protein